MLQNKAMLANLTIRQWTARKQDRKITAEVEQQHGAKDAGNFNKLLIDKAALLPFAQHGGRVRDYHYKMTLPWGDNGDRLLPSKAYMDYVAQMRAFRDEASRLADAFAQDYPTQVQTARIKLGGMYDPNDYPAIDGIRDRFSISISFLPVPDAADFRVDVGDEAVQEIRDSITNTVKERQAEAMKECWSRLYDTVGKIEQTMSKEKPIFRDSLIDNARELIEMLPRLNITEDRELLKICEFVSQNLIVPPNRLRRSPSLRQKVGAEATKVLTWIAQNLKSL